MDDYIVHVCPHCLSPRPVLRSETPARVICRACGFNDVATRASCVDEQSWITYTSPEYLLGCVTALGVGPSQRKHRLLYVAVGRAQFAWCRSAWFVHAIEWTERRADDEAAGDSGEFHRLFQARGPRTHSASRDAELLACDAVCHSVPQPLINFTDDTRRAFADAVRELFPNPFARLSWEPGWATSTVRDLAAHIYAAHEFGAMPLLADALQDAGCDAEPVLAHCRANRPHARGCWVLDTILGKL